MAWCLIVKLMYKKIFLSSVVLIVIFFVTFLSIKTYSGVSASNLISLKSYKIANNGQGLNSLSILKPDSVVAGDVLIAQLVVNKVSTIVTAPTGWNVVLTTQTSTSAKQIVYYKVATSIEPNEYVWSFSSSQSATGAISSFVGVDNENPIDVSSGRYNSSTSTVSFTQINTRFDNELILALVGISGNSTITPPLGFSEIYDSNNILSVSNGKTVELSIINKDNLGMTSVVNGSEDGTTYSTLAQLVALKPSIVVASTPTPTSTLSPVLSQIKNVFIVPMESYGMVDIVNNPSAPYINSLFNQGSYATQYYPAQTGVNLSLPQYLYMEAGDNFGIINDQSPRNVGQSTTDHLVTKLENAGVSWKSYQEGIDGTECPVYDVGKYAVRHNPMVYFSDVNSNAPYCISHVRPYSEFLTDLLNNSVAKYNFVTPDTCHDMHDNCTGDPIAQGDTWLSTEIPKILSSDAYKNGGAIFITFDNDDTSMSNTIPMIVLSPYIKNAGYSNSIYYNHASLLKTVQNIFGIRPYLRNAEFATDLSDLFTDSIPTSTALATMTPIATATPTATVMPTPTIIPTPTPTAPSQITIKSFSTNTNGTGSKTISINKPAGVVENDLLVTSLVVNSTTTNVIAPTGWTLIQSVATSGSMKHNTYYKIASTTEPVSYTWTIGTTNKTSTIGMVAISGVNTLNPVNIWSGKYNDTSKNINFNPVEITSNGTTILASVAVSGKTSITQPLGFTEVYDLTNSVASSGKSIELSYISGQNMGIFNAPVAKEDTITVSNTAQLIVLNPSN